MPRTTVIVALALLSLPGCRRSDQAQAPIETNAVEAGTPIAREAVDAGITPMPERVAVLGFLNKRNGIVRDLTMKPGQAIRIRDAVVRLRACEMTAPWEDPKLTGAFVQLDRMRPNGTWFRRFSGWLYKESPSLNVVEDPVYDVWPKSCAMSFPAGPPAPAAPSASSSASSAKKSDGAEPSPPAAAPAAETPPPAAANAVDSNSA